jgi:hypothetical protein
MQGLIAEAAEIAEKIPAPPEPGFLRALREPSAHSAMRGFDRRNRREKRCPNNCGNQEEKQKARAGLWLSSIAQS